MLGGGKAEAAESQDVKDQDSHDHHDSQDEGAELQEAAFDDGGGDFGDFDV